MDYDLLSWLEENLRGGFFSIVDKYLVDTSVNDLDTADILTVLTITSYGKDKLPNRESFLVCAEAALRLRLGDERALRLLKYRR